MAVMRTIREEEVVTARIDAAKTQHSRIEDIFDGIKWRLSREPESGYQLKGHDPPCYLFKVAGRIESLPVVTVLYSYGDDLVEIQDIRIQ